MGLGTSHQTVTTADKFIPQIWSDEVVATYKRNLVLANLIKKINMVGKKGDTLNIPKPGRGSATAKAASTQVTIVTDTATDVQVSLNLHFEYSILIEDIVETQALTSMRQFYTDDAGYALARQVDSSLIALGRQVQGGTNTTAYSGAFSGTDGTTAYVAGANTGLGALTDAAIRRSIQRLDDNDVPMDGRFLLVPPSTRNTLMGIARFTEQAFVGENGNSSVVRKMTMVGQQLIPALQAAGAGGAVNPAAAVHIACKTLEAMDLDPLDFLVDYTAEDFQKKAEQSRQAEAQAQEKKQKLEEQLKQIDIAQRQATLDLTNVQAANAAQDNAKQLWVSMDKSQQEWGKLYISAAKEGIELPPRQSAEELYTIAKNAIMEWTKEQKPPVQQPGNLPGPAAAPAEMM